MRSSSVRLVAEHVELYVDWLNERVQVLSVMELENTGGATTVAMGYPENEPERFVDESSSAPDSSSFRLSNFTVSIDGNLLAHERVRGEVRRGFFNAQEWRTWEAAFDTGQKRTLIVTYSARMLGDGGGDVANTDYILGTAHSWAGTPDTIVVTVHARYLPPEWVEATEGNRRLEIRPADFHQMRWIWAYNRHKPSPDERIEFHVRKPPSLSEETPQTQAFRAVYSGSQEWERDRYLRQLKEAIENGDFELAPLVRLLISNWEGEEVASRYVRFLILQNATRFFPLPEGPVGGHAFLFYFWGLPEENELFRNSIYARHGRKFQEAWLQEVFSRQPWYHPSDAPFDDTVLTEEDRRKIQRFLRLERLHRDVRIISD